MSNDLVSYVTSANSVIAMLYRRYLDHGAMGALQSAKYLQYFVNKFDRQNGFQN